ncbi:DUF4118 domain-containing protein [Epidermidibacterium keratini]|uniref:histidine kinase n=1 Tax=Epidermidibacterium keratini TaxID=1891644 RepID=A0A7L4YLS2_9ACTN|nr:DUF4118 domain-containing protein [Epidermidibacterium keratini]QHB99822.1 DUF4118 domain-containing protein [Epidermidibacterium keratini]
MTETSRPGTLRVYLGAAPGVGKTYAMLNEGRRRRDRGTDVVVGYVETHGRAKTADAAAGFEVVPRTSLTYRDAALEEMDTDAIIARHPQVALIDELAHSNAPGSRNPKRWQDVEQILAAGIDVITTLNVQHLESLGDVVTTITGTRQRETVPDAVVRRAAQIELVDMSPEALRRRMAHGNIYRPERIDAALANYFRVGNLTALRELALLWLADRVDEVLQRYRTDHNIDSAWPARERIVVAVTPDEFSQSLIRRGARIAARASATELMVVFVQVGDGVRRSSPLQIEQLRQITEALGGTFHEVVGDDVAEALLSFARGANASQIVIGTSRRNRIASALSPGVGDAVVRDAGQIDVHTVSRPPTTNRARRASPPRLGRTRRLWGWVLGIALPVLLTGVLAVTRNGHEFTTDVLLYLLVVVLVAIVGGRWPAVAAAVLGSQLLNYFFTPPLYTLSIAGSSNIIALAVFLIVAVAVAAVVDQAARTRRQAQIAQGRADTLSSLARQVLRGQGGTTRLLETMRESLELDEVHLDVREASAARQDMTWQTVASAGPVGHGQPDVIQAGDTVRLVFSGPSVAAHDRQVLEAYASHAAALHEHERLLADATEARAAAAGNQMRLSVLAAVSHDLRTPIATIKAAAGTLRHPGPHLDDGDRAELLEDIDVSADNLAGLVGNLLDMSRLQTGSLRPLIRPSNIDAVVLAALRQIPGSDAVEVDIAEDLPAVDTDPGLLERVVANVVHNALQYAAGSHIAIRASVIGTRAEIRVSDGGPGVPDARKADLFAAFWRLDDAPSGSGLGLGLAVASGFMTAMDGDLIAEDTPGGGLTMVLQLPVCAAGSEAECAS